MKIRSEKIRLLACIAVLLLATAACTGLLIYRQSAWLIAASLLVLIFSLVKILQLHQSGQRKLSLLINAIRNEDSSLIFPEIQGDHAMNQLHKSLNELNLKVSGLMVSNARKEHFFRTLIEHSTTGLLAADEQGFIEVVNNTAIQLTGLQQSGNLKRLSQSIPELHQALTTLRNGEKTVVKYSVNNEIVTISVQLTEVTLGEKNYRLCSMQDIRRELEKSETDSWQKLIRVLTHEIMNSIAPITSISQTLLHYFTPEDGHSPVHLTSSKIQDTAEGLQVISERGNALVHFVQNYRKLVRVPMPAPAPVNITSWLQNLERLFREIIQQHSIDFQIKATNQVSEIITDEQLLNQLVINLITNAIEAVCSSENTRQRSIRLQFESTSQQHFRFEITDNGPGIPPAILDKIFIPFFTTKTGGNGIGLSLSRQIANTLNLKLDAGSTPNQGSTFILESDKNG